MRTEGTTRMKGQEKVIKNLNKALAKIEVLSVQGMIKASILIQTDMDKTSPIVPVDTRNLQYSWYSTTWGFTQQGKEADSTSVSEATAKVEGSRKPSMIMGFTANYAAFVHEMPDTTNWSRRGSGGKFFEMALKRNFDEIVKRMGQPIKEKLR